MEIIRPSPATLEGCITAASGKQGPSGSRWRSRARCYCTTPRARPGHEGLQRRAVQRGTVRRSAMMVRTAMDDSAVECINITASDGTTHYATFAALAQDSTTHHESTTTCGTKMPISHVPNAHHKSPVWPDADPGKSCEVSQNLRCQGHTDTGQSLLSRIFAMRNRSPSHCFASLAL